MNILQNKLMNKIKDFYYEKFSLLVLENPQKFILLNLTPFFVFVLHDSIIKIIIPVIFSSLNGN